MSNQDIVNCECKWMIHYKMIHWWISEQFHLNLSQRYTYVVYHRIYVVSLTIQAGLFQSIFIPPTMENDQYNSEGVRLESHPFYQCIKPLIVLQKVAGGWIHRPLKTSAAKLSSCAFLLYCLFWQLITIGIVIRCLFFFTGDVFMQRGDMFIYLQVSMYVATSICQILSIFKYGKILPFWESLIYVCALKFSGKLICPKAIIWIMVICLVSSLFLVSTVCSYLIWRSEPEPLLLQLAQPWSDREVAKTVVTIAMYSFLPPCVTWLGANMFFLLATYYLCSGFRRLQGTMELDLQLPTDLSLYKKQHLQLSKLADMLDEILRGFIGATVAKSAFDLCFVIFTLHESHHVTEIIASVIILIVAVSSMATITVLSIVIHSRVSVKSTSMGYSRKMQLQCVINEVPSFLH